MGSPHSRTLGLSGRHLCSHFHCILLDACPWLDSWKRRDRPTSTRRASDSVTNSLPTNCFQPHAGEHALHLITSNGQGIHGSEPDCCLVFWRLLVGFEVA